MAIKLKDIAKILQISPATVSLVVNNRPGVSEETRNKVLKLIEEKGYGNNFMTKPAIGKNKNVRFIVYKKNGQVVSDTPFFQALNEGIDAEARKNGFHLVTSHINTQNDSKELKELLRNNPLDGVIILATEMTNEDLESIKNLKMPVVLLDSYFQNENFDTVTINNVQGAYCATKYLIDSGHKQLGHLKSSVEINNFTERNDGYLKALIEYGASERNMVFEVKPNIEDAYKDMLKILEDKPQMPTGLFADNDIIAVGAMKALKEKGYSIPEDVSIVGFDDMPFCEVVEPTLTTVKVFKQDMGMLAVRRLISQIQKSSIAPVKMEIGTELVIRNSVKRKIKRQ